MCPEVFVNIICKICEKLWLRYIIHSYSSIEQYVARDFSI